MSKNRKIKTNLLKPGFITVGFAMLIGIVFMQIDTATSGAEIAKMEKDIYALSQINQNLTQEVIKNSSVSAIDTGATSLGFSKPEKTVYLTVEDGVAAYAQ